MKSNIATAALVLIAVLCIAGGYPTCKCPNAGEGMYQELSKMLRVRRWEVVTNVFLQHDDRDPRLFQTMEYRAPFLATNFVTNLVIGTDRKELFRVEALK